MPFWRLAKVQKRCCSTGTPSSSATSFLKSPNSVCFFTRKFFTCAAATTSRQHTIGCPAGHLHCSIMPTNVRPLLWHL